MISISGIHIVKIDNTTTGECKGYFLLGLRFKAQVSESSHI